MATHPQLATQTGHVVERLSAREVSPLELVDDAAARQRRPPLQLQLLLAVQKRMWTRLQGNGQVVWVLNEQ